MIRAGTRHDLSQVKQEMNETLRSYTQRFFEMRTTIANTTDKDIIRCFQNRLFLKYTYHNFSRDWQVEIKIKGNSNKENSLEW
jgi:hypothetical protein